MEEEKSLFGLQADESTSMEMTDTSNWAKLLGIFMFIGMGLIILFFLLGWTKISFLISAVDDDSGTKAAMAIMLVFLVIIAGIVALLGFFLVRGSRRVKAGLQLKDQHLFNSGLGDIKSFFITYGVISLLGLALNLFSYLK